MGPYNLLILLFLTHVIQTITNPSPNIPKLPHHPFKNRPDFTKILLISFSGFLWKGEQMFSSCMNI